MSVWLTIPSARPPAEAEKCLALWRKQGYRIALWRDMPAWDAPSDPPCELMHVEPMYPGYAEAVNRLISQVMALDPHAEWFVTGGDDVEPDLNHTADEIAGQCSGYFRGLYDGSDGRRRRLRHHLSYTKGVNTSEGWGALSDVAATFGVMQPTGDRFANGSIDRIAGSPWIGREFARRMYGGNGPYWHEYRHMFLDEELQCVAEKHGVFWQRRDLIHLHQHFMRENAHLESMAVKRDIPPHLMEANSPEHWNKYQAIFKARKAAGFPGSEPL